MIAAAVAARDMMANFSSAAARKHILMLSREIGIYSRFAFARFVSTSRVVWNVPLENAFGVRN